jgi:hypothetical protein
MYDEQIVKLINLTSLTSSRYHSKFKRWSILLADGRIKREHKPLIKMFPKAHRIEYYASSISRVFKGWYVRRKLIKEREAKKIKHLEIEKEFRLMESICPTLMSIPEMIQLKQVHRISRCMVCLEEILRENSCISTICGSLCQPFLCLPCYRKVIFSVKTKGLHQISTGT